MPHIDEALLPYLRDCSDHAFQLLDMVEVYRETAQGLVDLLLSSISNRMNEVMKVLTMIATVFIPMTFIAGLYGMNFDRPTISRSLDGVSDTSTRSASCLDLQG